MKYSNENIKVETYTLYAGNGKKIRQATKVIFNPWASKPEEFKFTEKLGKNEAIKQAIELRGPSYPYSVTN